MKKQSKYILFSCLFVVLSLAAMAIPPAPGGGGLPPCFPGPCLPIDGGVSFLLAAAAVYGGKKLYDSQKKS